MNIALEILFFTLSNVKIDFFNSYMDWKMYIAIKTLLIIRKVKLIRKKKFAVPIFNLKDKAFIVHIASISQDSDIYSSQRAYIVFLKANKAPISVPSKYANFADIFSKNLVAKLPEHIKINNHTINIIEQHEFPYRSLYSLGSLKLETLKTYIETSLVNSYIRLSKFFIGALIFFVKKLNRSL